MNNSPTLRDVQKKTMQLTTFEDGFWDLLLGLIFMALAMYPITREMFGPVLNLTLFLAILAILVIGQLVLRHYVSVPRIGYARPRRTPKMRVILVITILLVLLTLGLVLLTLLSPESPSPANLQAPTNVRSYAVEWIVFLVMGALFAGMGYVFGVTRLYFYGWLLGLSNLASVYMSHTAGWTFLIPSAGAAGIIILIGLALLVRFLRKYPVQSLEA